MSVKRQTLDRTHAPHDVAALPMHCAKRVFAFAADNTLDNPLRRDLDLPLAQDLQRFAFVCTTWRNCARDILQERRDTFLCLNLACVAGGNFLEESLQALMTELLNRSKRIRELRLVLLLPTPGDNQDNQDTTLRSTFESAPIDWNELLSTHCANLLCLDLSGLPLHSHHLVPILHAVSTQCPQLRALLLPNKERHIPAIHSELLQNTFTALYSALERWHETNGGLRHLSVPRRCDEPADQFPQRTDEYVTAVAKFCPNIEYLDGWKATYEESDYIECEEMLFCNSDAWTAFCKSCASLRELNWFTIPFAGDFFRTFAKHPKPMLTTLTLAGDPTDKWADNLVDGSYYDGDGFDFTKHDVALVLDACPALRDLTIRLYNSLNELVTQELFDDAFLLKLAKQCPHLERFSFNELESGQPISASTVITDVGLRALASLPDLADVYMKQTSCTGAGVFAFVELMRRPQRFRRVELGVGNCDRTDFERFYTVLIELLSGFDSAPEDTFRRHRFELRVFRQYVGRDSVANGGRELLLRFAQLVSSLRLRYEPLFHLTVGGDGWDARLEDRADDELEKTLGTARVFVLASVHT